VKVFLSIAGSDSSCGAGVEQDTRTLNTMGTDCVTAVTGRTLQKPGGVWAIYPSCKTRLREEILFALNNFPIQGIKIGALFSKEQIECTTAILKDLKGSFPIVADPVFMPTAGKVFLDPEGRICYIKQLLPLADVITPNLNEAYEICRLAGLKISRGDSAETVAEILWKILSGYGKSAVITGGDSEGNVLKEYLIYGTEKEKRVNLIETVRKNFLRFHGTGCAFSSALLAGLAYGNTLEAAFLKAKKIVESMYL